MEAKKEKTNPEMKWYTIKTKVNCETKTAEAIGGEVKDHHLESQVGDILVPQKEVAEMVRGKKIVRSKKFYPGYVFIQLNLSNRLWHLIKALPHVVNFVGHQGTPVEVPEQQIQKLRNQIQGNEEKTHVKVAFSTGEHVKIIDGPFNSFTGVVEEVQVDKARLKVSVSIFGRSTPVELDFSQVNKEI